jgi:LacI family transcriptional regulator
MMSYDDIPEATIVSPALTVVARDLSSIGTQAAEVLFERIDGSATGPGRFFQSQWRIVERDSVKSI